MHQIEADPSHHVRGTFLNPLKICGMREPYRGYVDFFEDYAPVELRVDPLEQRTGHRVAVHDLPERRRAAAVFLLVVVMIGPDAVTSGRKNVASNDPISKFQNK